MSDCHHVKSRRPAGKQATPDEITAVLQLRKEGHTFTHIAKVVGFTNQTVGKIVARETARKGKRPTGSFYDKRLDTGDPARPVPAPANDAAPPQPCPTACTLLRDSRRRSSQGPRR